MAANRIRRVLPAALALALGATLTARADDPEKEKKDDSPITVYTPYKNLDEIFKDKGGGVFLPYTELEKLLREARDAVKNPTSPVEPAPPEPFVFVKSAYRGTADESVAHFEATFDFEVLDKKNWVDIPLGLGNVSLEEAKTADGKRAIVRQNPGKGGGGYSVLSKGAGPLSVTAKFTVKINKAVAGQRSFQLYLPKAALSTFDVDLPEHGLKVDVQPNIGQTTPSASDSSGKTHVTAYLSPSDAPVTVTWFPRPKEVESGGPQKSLVFSDVATACLLDEGVARALTVVKYVVEQAPADTFKIQVPKDWKVLEVNAKPAREMRDYDVTESGGKNVLRVSFHEKQKACEVSFKLERPRDDASGSKFDFPQVKTLETEREKGIIAAASSQYLKLEPTAKVLGLSQIDQSEIPAEIRGEVTNANVTGGRPPLGFRYLKNEYQLELETKKVEPEVDGKVFALATVKDDEVSFYATVAFEIKKRGIFSSRVRLPEGLTINDVNERAVKSWNVRSAGSADKGPDGKPWQGQILDLDFTGQLNPRPEPYLVNFTGSMPRKSALAQLALPVIGLDGVNKETGVLAVAAQKHLKLTSAGSTTGLVPVPAGELGSLGFPYAAQESEELVFGFKYGKPGAAASLDVSKREPKVTATVEMVANAELDRINVDGDIHYKVEFAGVDKLRLKVPKALGTDEAFKVTAEGASIKEKSLAAPPATPIPGDEDKVTWEIVLQAKREGTFRLHFHYEIKLDDMAPGATRRVGLHEVEALDSQREIGDLVLLKHENLVISNDSTLGLETKHATKEMPASLAKLNGFSGYHYVSHPWKLVLRIIKYDFQAPLQKIIEHLHVDEVVLRDGLLDCEAWIRLRNNQGQLLRVLLPSGTEASSPCLVNEKPVNLSTWGKEKGGIDVMLPEETRRGDAPVLVRIRYKWTKPRPFGSFGSLELESPTFPTDDKGEKASSQGVPVARFTRKLYLPDSVCYVDFDTDMTAHFERGGFFEQAKNLIFGHLRESEGAGVAMAAIDQIKASRSGTEFSSYSALKVPTVQGGDPSKTGPRLFEKLDCQAKLKVVYASWPILYFLGVVTFGLVIGLGAWLERHGRVSAVAYTAVAAGTTFLLAVVAGRSVEPYLTTAFVGSLGIGSYWLSRAVWRELTVESHRRKLEALAKEAEVAKARAQAAEAEAKAGAPRPAPAPTPRPTPKGMPEGADEAAADRIGFQEPPAAPSAPPAAPSA